MNIQAQDVSELHRQGMLTEIEKTKAMHGFAVLNTYLVDTAVNARFESAKWAEFDESKDYETPKGIECYNVGPDYWEGVKKGETVEVWQEVIEYRVRHSMNAEGIAAVPHPVVRQHVATFTVTKRSRQHGPIWKYERIENGTIEYPE